ncbi:MAG TPA: HDOD domain-containing protein [Smithellaceae bacterium]|nr:HDOD domain-containing protein [Smithellaceae bacterium]
MDNNEIISILDSIEEKMIDKVTLGFSPEVLGILDDVEASNHEIELLKARISNEILMRIFNIANSAYYGSLRKGSIYTFYEVVTRLGMSHTKALIIILALQLLVRGDKEIEIIFARSFASSVLGKILAQQFGMREDNVKRVELGGLFSEIGRMMIVLYKKLHAADDARIDEIFIRKYHPYLAERIIDKFALPDYLKQMIFSESIVVEESYITVSGIAQLAINFVAAGFHKFNNRLVIEAVFPTVSGRDETVVLEKIVEDQFNAVNLGKYLHIIRKRERLLPRYENKKKR